MKRFIAVLLLIPLVFLCACNPTVYTAPPKSGIWYCEELKISIDFSLYGNTNNMAKLYSDDGTFENYICEFDHYSNIYISQAEQSECLLIGGYTYENDEFIVKNDDGTYIFTEIKTEPST